MNDQEAILFNNDAFYAAFSCGGIAAESCLWAQTDDVSVIHTLIRSGGGSQQLG